MRRAYRKGLEKRTGKIWGKRGGAGGRERDNRSGERAMFYPVCSGRGRLYAVIIWGGL